jgi:uroporphyrinogen-III synthase
MTSPVQQLWVTRPNPDGEQMAQLARDAGMMPWQMPVMDIFWQSPAHEALRQLMQAQIIIVTSRYAVTSLEKSCIDWPTQATYLAVGAATAKALHQRGVEAIVPTQSDSEGLLNEPVLAHTEGKGVVILKGEGGRTTLLTQLTKRGALVTEIPLYRRVCKPVDQGMLTTFLQQDQAVVSVASAESLTCAMNATPVGFRRRLMALPLAVMSQRIADFALAKGWQGEIQVATVTSSGGLIEAAKACR